MPKILIFDIETSPVLAYVWGLHDQNIGLNQIYRDWYVIAWAAKWLGEPASKTLYMDLRHVKNKFDDKPLLKAMWKLLNEADIVITQNGRNFDSKKLNARFIIQGMKPPRPYQHWDTLEVARRVAKFTSNKLEYMTDKVNTKYKKLLHKNFPGFELWKECLAGNPAAWKEMKVYNIHDVLSTEEFYTKIRAWAPQSTPNAFQVYEIGYQCGVCGNDGKLQQRGYNYTRVSRFKKLQCMKCKTWTLGKREAL